MQYPIPHKRRLFHCKHIGTVLTFAEFSIKILLIAPFACGEGAKTSTHDTPKESCLLLSVDDGSFDAEGSLLELRRLAESAGATVFAVVEQKRESPDAATYIGHGRLEEIRELCEREEIDLLIADGELTPTQQRNMENFTDTRVIDRTTLILDIFAKNARTSEGKLQVELAQLNYLLPRLAGQGRALSRLGGGIGTRGPGETKLESDRRHIRRRIHALEEQLKRTQKQRALRRHKRKNDGIQTVAIVGYTNAGKSTLLNALTSAGVLAEDKLFATLDPTARALKLPDGRQVMLIDTVGFISRLPHTLVEAFHSTLEEAADADIILNVCDASDPQLEKQIRVTTELLEQLGAGSVPTVTIFNKCDACGNLFVLPFGRNTVRISARTGEGLPQLLQEIARVLPGTVRVMRLRIPYADAGETARLRRLGKVENECFEPDGITLTAALDSKYAPQFQKYMITEP